VNLIKNEKILGLESPLTKPYRDAKERTILFNHLVDFLWSLGSHFLATDAGVIYRTHKCKVQSKKTILWLLKVLLVTYHILEKYSCLAHMSDTTFVLPILYV
jgi:hypothetical protein